MQNPKSGRAQRYPQALFYTPCRNFISKMINFKKRVSMKISFLINIKRDISIKIPHKVRKSCIISKRGSGNYTSYMIN